MIEMPTEEIKALLIARSRIEGEKQKELNVLIQKELGNEIQTEQAVDIAVKNEFANQICGITAIRLKYNSPDEPLLSPQDINNLSSSMLEYFVALKGCDLEDREQKILEAFMAQLFENLLKTMENMVPAGSTMYAENWRWIETVIQMASERGISTAEFLSLKEAWDEISRKMFTKEQYSLLSKKSVAGFLDIDMLKKTIIGPMLVAFSENEEDRQEMEQELEEELMPQLRLVLEKSKIVINSFLEEEISRIYKNVA